MSNEEIKIVSYGGGVDSTAMLIGLHQKDIRVDYILFADTGGEQPETYAFIEKFSKWLSAHSMPEIVTVRYKTKHGEEITLEQDVINNQTLPAIAFGWKTCSQKFKILPIERWIKANVVFGDQKPVKFIGFEAGEERRMKDDPSGIFTNRYPLIEWGWNREKAKQVIEETGLCLPPKSSCFFCPHMKKSEILQLPADLKERAMRMERNATKVAELKGLGRKFSWTELIEADDKQSKIFDDLDLFQTPCECID